MLFPSVQKAELPKAPLWAWQPGHQCDLTLIRPLILPARLKTTKGHRALYNFFSLSIHGILLHYYGSKTGGYGCFINVHQRLMGRAEKCHTTS